MQVVCSPVGFIDARSPRQGIKDMLGTGLKSTVLDVNLFCWYDVRRHGWDMARFHKKLSEANDAIKTIKDGGLSFAVADGPLWGYPRVGKPDEKCLMELTREAMRVAAEYGVGTIMIHPSKFEDAKALLPLAKELHLHLLVKNETRDIGGHPMRGFSAEPSEAVRFIDALNDEAGEKIVGFVLDMVPASLCGQDMQAMVRAYGDRLEAVIASDVGENGEAYLPFFGRRMATDWLSLLRGLRDVDFDGMLIVRLDGTMAAVPPLIRPSFLPVVEKSMDYLVWQINLEKPLKTYPSVVLFGAGNMCQNYMACYGEKYPPLFTCDNNKKRWGEKFCGLEVKSPEALRSIPDDTVILICNVYYREIEAQLRDMKLKNPIAYFNDEYMPKFTAKRINWEEVE